MIEAEFRRRTREYLEENHRKLGVAWERFREADLWHRPNEACLAPANQILHLTGNLRQWVLANLGGEPDERERDAEFAARSGPRKDEIWRAFDEVMTRVLVVLDGPIDAARALRIQGHDTTPVGVWIHVTEHLSYHTGQLIFHAKALYGEGFDFYGHWELGATNPGLSLRQASRRQALDRQGRLPRPAIPAIPATPAPTAAATGLAADFERYVSLLANGSFLDSITHFYADDVVQYENADEPTFGRDALLAAEYAAEKRIRSAEIKVCDAVIDEARGLVWGEMDIHFVSSRGLEQRLREAFRQNWRDGKIVEQRFYYKAFETVEG